MKKTKLGRSDRFFSPEAYLFILSSLLIVWFFGLIYLLFFSLVLLCAYTLIRLFNRQHHEQKRLLNKTKSLADVRLIFLKQLIMLAYETDKELFHRKFMAAVGVDELRKNGIVDVDYELLHKRVRRHMEEDGRRKLLTEKDIELCCLLLHGFSSAEITVVYNLKNVNSAYMKTHRLRNKLETLGMDKAV